MTYEGIVSNATNDVNIEATFVGSTTTGGTKVYIKIDGSWVPAFT